MSQSKYVILAHDGSSHDCSQRVLFTIRDNRFDLVELLEQGWRPVHETPLGRCPFYDAEGKAWEYSCVLILLVKD
jgi:hypothetical protein